MTAEYQRFGKIALGVTSRNWGLWTGKISERIDRIGDALDADNDRAADLGRAVGGDVDRLGDRFFFRRERGERIGDTRQEPRLLADQFRLVGRRRRAVRRREFAAGKRLRGFLAGLGRRRRERGRLEVRLRRLGGFGMNAYRLRDYHLLQLS